MRITSVQFLVLWRHPRLRRPFGVLTWKRRWWMSAPHHCRCFGSWLNAAAAKRRTWRRPRKVHRLQVERWCGESHSVERWRWIFRHKDWARTRSYPGYLRQNGRKATKRHYCTAHHKQINSWVDLLRNKSLRMGPSRTTEVFGGMKWNCSDKLLYG